MPHWAATSPQDRRPRRLIEEATMHKIAISAAALDRMTTRMGKLHPFDVIDPHGAALVVIDMQNYFVKPGAAGRNPAGARDRPQYQPVGRRPAPPRRPRRVGAQRHQGYPRELVGFPRMPDDAGSDAAALRGHGYRRRRLRILAFERYPAGGRADHQDAIQRLHSRLVRHRAPSARPRHRHAARSPAPPPMSAAKAPRATP